MPYGNKTVLSTQFSYPIHFVYEEKFGRHGNPQCEHVVQDGRDQWDQSAVLPQFLAAKYRRQSHKGPQMNF